MFSKHVTHRLLAYCRGELREAEARRIAEHLRRCGRCRAELDTVKHGDRLMRLLPTAAAPPSLWGRIEARLDEPAIVSQRRPFVPRVFVPLTASLVLALGLAGIWRVTSRKEAAKASWQVARLSGAPRIGARTIGGTARLRVGEWLQTDDRSSARLAVADIGSVEVAPNSRLRLVETHPGAHRLALARGSLRASVNAPPRLFFVETPSAVAVDLGCAYTLGVDDAGGSLLRVTSGWVALEREGRESIVPAGAVCATRPGIGPGTPCFADAPETLKRALRALDFERGGTAALRTVLAQAREKDSLTLWHLLSRVGPDERPAVYERLAALAPPPEDVTRAGVLRLDPAMLDSWRDEIAFVWWE